MFHEAQNCWDRFIFSIYVVSYYSSLFEGREMWLMRALKATVFVCLSLFKWKMCCLHPRFLKGFVLCQHSLFFFKANRNYSLKFLQFINKIPLWLLLCFNNEFNFFAFPLKPSIILESTQTSSRYVFDQRLWGHYLIIWHMCWW